MFTRREMLQRLGTGLGVIGLAGLLRDQNLLAQAPSRRVETAAARATERLMVLGALLGMMPGIMRAGKRHVNDTLILPQRLVLPACLGYRARLSSVGLATISRSSSSSRPVSEANSGGSATAVERSLASRASIFG